MRSGIGHRRLLQAAMASATSADTPLRKASRVQAMLTRRAFERSLKGGYKRRFPT
jgi:hypothetical protein